MKLTLNVIGERVKAGTYNYSTPQNENYTVADVALEGTTTFVAHSLRALADSIDPNGASR